MRHKNIHRKFGREHQHRMAMLRNQVTSLLTHERIHTTDAKAKEIRGIAEKVITLGKRGDLHARRIAFRTVRDKEVLHKVFSELADRFRTRPGGYTRVLKLGQRLGDMAPLSMIELLPDPNAPAKTEKAEKPAAKPKKVKAEKHDHDHDHEGHDHDHDHDHAEKPKAKKVAKATKAPKVKKAKTEKPVKAAKAPAKKK
jgi:large subunit ribosomal protein L17